MATLRSVLDRAQRASLSGTAFARRGSRLFVRLDHLRMEEAMRQVFRFPAMLAVLGSVIVFAGCSLQLKLDPPKAAAVPEQTGPTSGGSAVSALNRLLDSPDPQV